MLGGVGDDQGWPGGGREGCLGGWAEGLSSGAVLMRASEFGLAGAAAAAFVWLGGRRKAGGVTVCEA